MGNNQTLDEKLKRKGFQRLDKDGFELGMISTPKEPFVVSNDINEINEKTSARLCIQVAVTTIFFNGGRVCAGPKKIYILENAKIFNYGEFSIEIKHDKENIYAIVTQERCEGEKSIVKMDGSKCMMTYQYRRMKPLVLDKSIYFGKDQNHRFMKVKLSVHF